ncbi:MAG: glutamate formimidoyltransferase [Anaerolineae bacterium]|nr:glutamate formimidoyltransferase [Anaerolineae bacterium]
MPDSIIECIPNFSEARNPEVLKRIRDAILRVRGIVIIDQHSDLDHNRTVITMLGSPASIEEAAFQCVACAAGLINLEHHEGQHPRIGATDVLPFIPIRNATMTQCVEIARRVGRRIGTELEIPVYLYEEAATHDDRRLLENIRRGQYEGLKREITTNPARLPDFGPARLSTAGATAVGARQPLIAFNVYLTSNDINIAKKIAAVIRHSSGGLHYVKALGMLVNGMAQVSMNLTNFKQTSLHHTVEMIRREAERYGTAIHHSELVGLIPQRALLDSARWYLQLDQFTFDQILESKLTTGTVDDIERDTLGQPSFLDSLSSISDHPGEITAAAHTAATAIALIIMVARKAIEQSDSPEMRSRMISLIERVESHRQELDLAEKSIGLEPAAPVDAAINQPLDPEQAAQMRELKENYGRLRIQSLTTLAAHCSAILPLAQMVGENCENTGRHPLITASRLAFSAFECIAAIIQCQYTLCTDHQFVADIQKNIGERTVSCLHNMEQLTAIFEGDCP